MSVLEKGLHQLSSLENQSDAPNNCWRGKKNPPLVLTKFGVSLCFLEERDMPLQPIVTIT